MRYLDKEYKQTEFSRTEHEQHPPKTLASERIESTLGSEIVERFRKEILEEEL